MNAIATGKEQDSLFRLSAQIGRNPLLVQASSGNTSLKADGTLWIKASGKWLASASEEEIFVPINLTDCLQSLRQGSEKAFLDSRLSRAQLRPSIETFMHAVLPHRVVIHVHSVNTIAWAVRTDAVSQLAERLSGLRWRWIRYAPSGLPLAREIQSALFAAPQTDVFVLANHGLVVCGDDCGAAESRLGDVERRLQLSARPVAKAKPRLLELAEPFSNWRVAADDSIHFLGTDDLACRIADGGILYPCQAMFLGHQWPRAAAPKNHSDFASCTREADGACRFIVAEGLGVLIDNRMTASAYAVLGGFAEVLRRLDSKACIRYLTSEEINTVLGVYERQYKEYVETPAPCR